MRLSRLNLGMLLLHTLGMSGIACAEASSYAGNSLRAFANTIRLAQPSHHKSKPNKVSQAKRRKYKRQGRG